MALEHEMTRDIAEYLRDRADDVLGRHFTDDFIGHSVVSNEILFIEKSLFDVLRIVTPQMPDYEPLLEAAMVTAHRTYDDYDRACFVLGKMSSKLSKALGDDHE